MHFRKASVIAGFICCVIIILGLLGYLALPGLAQYYMEKRLLRAALSFPLDFKIEKIGFSTAGITDVRLKDSLSADRILFEYRLNGLRNIYIKKIIVSGLTVAVRVNENKKFSIPGIELPDRENKKAPAGTAIAGYLPDKIVLKNSAVDLQLTEKKYRIPVEILSKTDRQKNRLNFQISAYPFGEKVGALISYDLEKGVEKIQVEADIFDLSHLNSLMPEASPSKKIFSEGKIVDFQAVFDAEATKKYKSRGKAAFKHPFTGSIPVGFSADISVEERLIFKAEVLSQDIETLVFKNNEAEAKIINPLVSISINGSPDRVSGDFKAGAEKIKLVSGASNIDFPEVLAGGTFNRNKGEPFYFNMLVNASGGTADLPEYQTKISGISLSIPYDYPSTTPKSRAGNYAVKKIAYKKQYVFNTKGRIRQTGQKSVRISGKAGFDLIRQGIMDFTLSAEHDKTLTASVNFRAEPFLLTEKDFIKNAPKWIENEEIEARVSAVGRVEVKKGKISSSMEAVIENGRFYSPDMKVKAEGANTEIRFNSLLVPETLPGQVLTVDSLEMDNLHISDAKIRFSLDDAASLLIENIRFKWCNGLVTTESIQFPQENENYMFTLFCDRLELAQLLEQVGAFRAEGSGTLSGRIPIVYSDGDISFDNGFLFSTPGSGGKIRIENTDKLTAGIPLDSPQFAELDVAREALKDFSYEWAKLAFNTFEDTLHVNMELDGKPSRILPFEYQKDVGRFVRVDASSPGSHFQGIKLDVNLNLPFNDVMEFGNKLKSIIN